ncbi:MAG: hypothetical protein WBG50_27535 [Desulfomonilaceae bacterium]
MEKYVKDPERSTTVVGICLVCWALFVLYTALDTKGFSRFPERPGWINYGMLAEAFTSGQLYLKQKVDQQRLNSRHPLDPATPWPFMFDTIIWNGKYYFHHEPLPGLIRAMVLYTTGLAPPTGAVVVTVTFGVLILLGVLLFFMRRRYFAKSGRWILWYIWFSFSLSGVQLYIASRPVVYHEAMAEGCFFVLAGCILLVLGLNSARHGLIAVAGAGACFGAAIACRVFLVLYPMCFLLTFLVFSAIRRESVSITAKWTLSFACPVFLSIMGLLAYNYLRFGNPLDFGKSHIIFPEYSDYLYITVGGHFFSWRHISHQLYYYLLSLPRIVRKFPFLSYPDEKLWINGVHVFRELVCSVFITMPVLLLSLPSPIIFRHRQTGDSLSLLLAFFLISSLTVLTALSSFYGSAARYYYDFTPILFILAFCSLAVLWDRAQVNSRSKKIAKGVLLLLFISNVMMGLLLACAGTKQW